MSVHKKSAESEEVFDSTAFLRTAPEEPGVYLMLDGGGGILYVGKARCLKKRLASYFHKASGHNPRIRAMLAKVQAVDTTVTRTEGEALLLEQNMIKAHRPPYNVLLRDDKSYPSIRLSGGPWPALSRHRGARRGKSDRYFGPYPDAGAVKETLALLQKNLSCAPVLGQFFFATGPGLVFSTRSNDARRPVSGWWMPRNTGAMWKTRSTFCAATARA